MRARADAAVAVLVAATAITIAVVIHRSVVICAYLVGQPSAPCPGPADYTLEARLVIAFAGLLGAAFVLTLGGLSRRRRGASSASG